MVLHAEKPTIRPCLGSNGAYVDHAAGVTTAYLRAIDNIEFAHHCIFNTSANRKMRTRRRNEALQPIPTYSEFVLENFGEKIGRQILFESDEQVVDELERLVNDFNENVDEYRKKRDPGPAWTLRAQIRTILFPC